MRFFPKKEHVIEWGPQQWIGWLAGVATVLTAVAGFTAWVLDTLPLPWNVEGPPSYPSPTGRLGVSFEQNGRRLTLQSAPDLFAPEVEDLDYAYTVVLDRGPFSMTLPRWFCDGTVDALESGVAIRIMPRELWRSLAYIRGSHRARTYESYFPFGSGMAAGWYALTELLFDRPQPKFPNGYPTWTGFNYFYGQRYAAVTDESLSIFVNQIRGLRGQHSDSIFDTGESVIFIIGIAAAQCEERNGLGIDFVKLIFR